VNSSAVAVLITTPTAATAMTAARGGRRMKQLTIAPGDGPDRDQQQCVGRAP
jgi:hypothetical protein